MGKHDATKNERTPILKKRHQNRLAYFITGKGLLFFLGFGVLCLEGYINGTWTLIGYDPRGVPPNWEDHRNFEDLQGA
jgi:hypothetical protein